MKSSFSILPTNRDRVDISIDVIALRPYLDSDVVFGVKDGLIRKLEHQASGLTLRGNTIDRPMAALRYDFVLSKSR
ncbi:hypothetical protein [Glaciimonas sp. PCH181]|uniref:hypothetical protein n=1 Tax=Glaciimonas sp. PCH181 TaxID=2133943 RepID=UPI00191C4330|nr:hypothetical protein [Glaciimonas sp. PCH181]